jgi:hypothetical protein
MYPVSPSTTAASAPLTAVVTIGIAAAAAFIKTRG